jgi:hypothetical protein
MLLAMEIINLGAGERLLPVDWADLTESSTRDRLRLRTRTTLARPGWRR